MNIKELESFCSAAQLLSFSRAAKSLNIGQPTVTKHIRKLEAELARELFIRNERPVQLTEAGKTLRQIALPLIEGLRTFQERGAKMQQSSPVSVACPHGFTNELLLRAVQGFRERFPQCQLRIRVGTKAEVLKMVSDGEVDLAIVPSPDDLKNLVFQPLTASERVLITPLDHPLRERRLTAISDLAAYPLILLGYRTQTRDLVEKALQETGAEYEVALELDSMEMVKRYVELGLGVGVGHRAALDAADLAHLGVIPLGEFLPSELVGLVTRRGHELSMHATEFAATLRLSLRRNEMALPGLVKQSHAGRLWKTR